MGYKRERAGATFYERPEFYDLIFGFRKIPREVDYIQRVHSKYAGRGMTSLLDLACGTGEHVLEFARRGIQAVGVDISPLMIAHAVAKARTQHVNADFVLGDMAKLSFKGPFDCAVCMFHSLPLLTTNAELWSHFAGVSDCLAPPGIYIVEMGSPRAWFVDPPKGPRDLWEERCWTELRDGARIRATTYRDAFDIRSETMRIEMTVEVAAPGVSLRLTNAEIHRLLLPESLAAIAWGAGKFRLVEVHGDFASHLPYDGSARCSRMICVFVRQPERRQKRDGSRPEQFGLELERGSGRVAYDQT